VSECTSNGSGSEHGCPEGAWCYVYDGDEGFYCTRVCETDDDCTIVNPDLRCEERSSTEGAGVKICVPSGGA
jgi:hypothetical protein